MNGDRLETLLSKFYAKQLNDDEKIEFEAILNNSDEARQIFHDYNFVNQSLDVISFSKKYLDIKGNNKVKFTPFKFFSIEHQTAKKMIVNVAAILALPLLIALVYTLIKINSPSRLAYNEVTCTKGRVTDIALSDGSKVHLFSGSKLIYPTKFAGKDRSVSLIGEAAFEVHANPKKPFFVTTENHESVKAYGTKFIVCSYHNDSEISVYLEKGKVDFSSPKLSKSIVMYPKSKLFYNMDKIGYYLQDVSNFDFNAYKDGSLIFANEPLRFITKKLTKTFGIDIDIQNDDLKQTCFTASFKDQSLLKILNHLHQAVPRMQWVTDNDKIILFEQGIKSNIVE